MDLENNVKLPNPYHGMVTPGFAKGTDGSSWGWTVFPAHAAVWTNSTEPASCALLHEGGQNPCPNLALNFIFALYMHIKGWKNLAENKEKKDAALKMVEAAIYCLVKQEKDLQPAEETKPSSIHHYWLWVWWKQQCWG